MQTSQCMSFRSLQERREGLETFQTSINRVIRWRKGRRRRKMMMMRRRRYKGRGVMRRISRTGWWYRRS